MIERQGERDRDWVRQGERDRETGRERDRKRDMVKERQGERDRDRVRQGERDRETGRERDMEREVKGRTYGCSIAALCYILCDQCGVVAYYLRVEEEQRPNTARPTPTATPTADTAVWGVCCTSTASAAEQGEHRCMVECSPDTEQIGIGMGMGNGQRRTQ